MNMKKTFLIGMTALLMLAGCARNGQEEEILVPEVNLLLSYSLSNNLSEIERAITARTGLKIALDNIPWSLNTDLSASVKDLMNKHNVNYSMTIFNGDGERLILVNRRVGNIWYIWQEKLKPGGL
ncbi:MAG: hypothetical protein LBG84_00265 [Treponema sp.]|jgi:hypothetical protein|nr:hypothetical protein [Treponema sp.]